MSSTDWQDEKQQEVFEGTLKGLEARKRKDPKFTLETAQAELNHFYIQDGNNWLGRGELGDIVISATIAAYEHFISEWRSQSDSASNGPKQENPHASGNPSR